MRALMNKDFEQLDFLRMGGETKRYHAWPVLQEQNVAEHSCHVAFLCAWLAQQDSVPLRVNLLMSALAHDWAEQKWGDLPAPTKQTLPPYSVDGEVIPFRKVWGDLEAQELRKHGLDWEHTLTPEEERILKLCDLADGCLYCIRERAMGNRLITQVYINFRRALDKVNKTRGSIILEDYIDYKWKEATE
jgi:5'-deoxynucleotidase YfbR-like HD superfamily hydrolase